MLKILRRRKENIFKTKKLFINLQRLDSFNQSVSDVFVSKSTTMMSCIRNETVISHHMMMNNLSFINGNIPQTENLCWCWLIRDNLMEISTPSMPNLNEKLSKTIAIHLLEFEIVQL